jgi:hypothetical protein
MKAAGGPWKTLGLHWALRRQMGVEKTGPILRTHFKSTVGPSENQARFGGLFSKTPKSGFNKR